MPTPEERARSICVIAKATRPRQHDNCGECKRVAAEIRAAVEAERERIRGLAVQFLEDYTSGYDALASDSWGQFVAAMREGE